MNNIKNKKFQIEMNTRLNNKQGGFVKYLGLFLVFIIIVTTFSIDVADIVESEPVQFTRSAIGYAWSHYWQPWLGFAWNEMFVPAWNWLTGFFPSGGGEEVAETINSTVETATDIIDLPTGQAGAN